MIPGLPKLLSIFNTKRYTNLKDWQSFHIFISTNYAKRAKSLHEKIQREQVAFKGQISCSGSAVMNWWLKPSVAMQVV
jgi:hypothetical protein